MAKNDQNVLDSEIADSDLPLEIPRSVGNEYGARKRRRFPRYFFLLFIPLLLFTGAVIGIYVQPPALRAFLYITGLKPGGGTNSPIAVPVETVEDSKPAQATVRSVVALGRLVPEGKVITVSPPFGSADALIDEIKVAIGDRVERGDTLALLDNRGSLESALKSAEANVELQKSTLDQIRMTVGASLEEAQAARQRAKAGAALALGDYNRIKALRDQSAVSQSEFEQAAAALTQAQKDVAKAAATETRFSSQSIESQPDVAVAEKKIAAAIADLNRAKQDMERSIVQAPVSGTILDIHARRGEKPATRGILDIGNVEQMTAELEVYQSEIGLISVGQRVCLTADPLDKTLSAIVSEIGYTVERQTTIGDDPAANTDARVIRVTVKLDDESSKLAAKLTNLEVTGRIAVEEEAK